jgi:hypothetical protein
MDTQKPKRTLSESQKAAMAAGRARLAELRSQKAAAEAAEGTPVASVPTVKKPREEVLITADGRTLEVSVAGKRWAGKEITISESDIPEITRGAHELDFDSMFAEVVRLLKDGGYKFTRKDAML